MEKKFSIDDVPLDQLLDRAGSGALQLPDFQRNWVWDDDHIRSLLASISLSYPIGAVMTLAAGNPEVNFKTRLLEGVGLRSTPVPEVLLLDGQQRLTSLFQALKSGAPVRTRDNRGNALERRYYAAIEACIDPDADREEDGIVAVPADRLVRSDFGRRVELDLSTRDSEIAAGLFPLDIALDSGATMDWQMAYLRPELDGEQKLRYEKWKLFHDGILRSFEQYQVPTIALAKSTPKEAVCQVFEKVNTGGVTLTVFELLTATYSADGFELRTDWRGRRERLEQDDLFVGEKRTEREFLQTAFLQIVTLLATYDRRRVHLQEHAGDDRAPAAPAVSCKRREILRLPLDDYRRWAKRAEEGLKRAAAFLREQFIFLRRDLPYATQLVPLGAIFGYIAAEAETLRSKEKLAQWYWCGVLGEMYGGSTETRFAIDLEDCIGWIDEESEADLPRTVRAAQFQAERLLTLRTRNSAAYKGVHAVQIMQGARDFGSGRLIDLHAYMDDAIDIHHIFPQRWCRGRGIEQGHADCIVNKTALAARTNRRIGGDAPSRYLLRLEATDGIRRQELDGFLRSHDIDPAALRGDDFEEFFNRRFETLLRHVERVMGKAVNRRADRDESPFGGHGKSVEEAVRPLIESGESSSVEFKSTARHNLRSQMLDDAVTWAVVKTIAAFMNTFGGTLLVGVDDDGQPIGIESDYPYVKGRNRDGWELWFTAVVKRALGRVAATEVPVRFCEINDRAIARVDVRPSAEPVFATRKGKPREVFFVRLNNATEELAGQALLDYRRRHWPE